jgi:hypothetical protein
MVTVKNFGVRKNSDRQNLKSGKAGIRPQAVTMTEAAKDIAVASVKALLVHYSFDRGGKTPEQLVAEWLKEYPAAWVRLGAIEALYQGRYKAVSVTHILACWKRRNQPLYHFNHEFESLVCSKLPVEWKASGQTDSPPARIEAVSPQLEEVPEIAPPPVKPADPPAGVFSPKPTAKGRPPGESQPAEQKKSSGDARRSPPPRGAELPKQPSPQSDRPASPTIGDRKKTSPPPPSPAKPASASSRPVAKSPKVPSLLSREQLIEAVDSELDDLLADLWREKPAPSAPPLSPNSGASKTSKPPEEPLPETRTPEKSESVRHRDGESLPESPIHQFTPKVPPSDFYSRLKAVAQTPRESAPNSSDSQ